MALVRAVTFSFFKDAAFVLFFMNLSWKINYADVILCRFLRGDQYAIALALLDEGKVVLGVLACPNLPLTSIVSTNQNPSPGEVGCLFFSVVGCGTYMESLDSSSAVKVCTVN